MGAVVLRLKGGDPLVFGRGGEECEYLRSRGVAVDVSPGITAASGIAAELGVPLTHRGVASSVRFLTGHARDGGPDAPPEPSEEFAFGPADVNCTLVLYMGLGTLGSLQGQLLAAGLPASTPALAVERGTTAVQRRLFARLGGVAAASVEAKLRSPTLIFIGRCVALSPLWPWRGEEGEGWVLQEGSPGSAFDARSVRIPGGGEVVLPAARRGLQQPEESQRKR